MDKGKCCGSFNVFQGAKREPGEQDKQRRQRTLASQCRSRVSSMRTRASAEGISSSARKPLLDRGRIVRPTLLDCPVSRRRRRRGVLGDCAGVRILVWGVHRARRSRRCPLRFRVSGPWSPWFADEVAWWVFWKRSRGEVDQTAARRKPWIMSSCGTHWERDLPESLGALGALGKG